MGNFSSIFDILCIFGVCVCLLIIFCRVLEYWVWVFEFYLFEFWANTTTTKYYLWLAVTDCTELVRISFTRTNAHILGIEYSLGVVEIETNKLCPVCLREMGASFQREHKTSKHIPRHITELPRNKNTRQYLCTSFKCRVNK